MDTDEKVTDSSAMWSFLASLMNLLQLRYEQSRAASILQRYAAGAHRMHGWLLLLRYAVGSVPPVFWYEANNGDDTAKRRQRTKLWIQNLVRLTIAVGESSLELHAENYVSAEGDIDQDNHVTKPIGRAAQRAGPSQGGAQESSEGTAGKTVPKILGVDCRGRLRWLYFSSVKRTVAHGYPLSVFLSLPIDPFRSKYFPFFFILM